MRDDFAKKKNDEKKKLFGFVVLFCSFTLPV